MAASSDTADAEASAVTAIVTVERTTGVAGTEGVRSDMIARFVRSRAGAVDEDALRIVGAALDLPAPGACTRLSPASSAPAKVARGVELVNVGTVSVELLASGPPEARQGPPEARPSTPSAGAKVTEYQGTLLPRHLPDVVDLVSGIVYTARADGDAFPARGRYVFHATGAQEQEIAPFTVEATASGEPGEIRIGDQALVPRAADAVPIGISPSDPTEITWTPSAESDGAANDLVYIDVSARPVGISTVRCSFADGGGRATLAPSTFGSEEGTIAVHRVHREPFRAKGIDSGVLRFDFARVSTFRRR